MWSEKLEAMAIANLKVVDLHIVNYLIASSSSVSIFVYKTRR